MRSEEANPSVVAQSLSKTYRLGEMLRLESTVRTLMGRPPTKQRFDALHDVTFSTSSGECFGIVGTNGSGKSTILQVLAGITMPTSGTVEVHGTVLPLLAIGAGFHQELTGRENSFLFGTILGLDRDLITSRLDDIGRFAELERHFETPLKRYSSGMQARLCFAIAMLFPASIYCFDEVLAVVDGEFKDRCMAEIRSLADAGGTVFFISHDREQVARLCDRVMWLEQGKVRAIGAPEEVLDLYEEHTALS
jgi:ABC-type polysaccharide/polyol phosphate transport system ATPase subunit